MEGWRVTAIARSSSKNRKLILNTPLDNICVVDADARDIRCLRQYIQSADVVFPLTAPAGGRSALEIEPHLRREADEIDEALIHTLIELGENGPLTVGAGSRLQYGNPHSLPVNESTPLEPVCKYGLWKNHQEALLRGAVEDYGIRATWLRISSVYGHSVGKAGGFGGGIVATFFSRASSNQPLDIFDTGSQIRDYIYIDDLLGLLGKIVSNQLGEGETFNAGGFPLSVRELAELIMSTCGAGSLRFRNCPAAGPPETGDYIGSTDRAFRVLGWRPRTSLQSGIWCTWKLGRSEVSWRS
jgi:UDP-glucose 4-epimerase